MGNFFLFLGLALAEVCLGPGFPKLNLRFESELPQLEKSAKGQAVPFS